MFRVNQTYSSLTTVAYFKKIGSDCRTPGPLLRDNIDQFVAEVNEAIRDGKVPPKSKMPELVPRVAAALHVFHHTMSELLAGVPASAPPTEISKSTLETATEFVQHLESQKELLCQVSNPAITSAIAKMYHLLITLSHFGEFLFYGLLKNKINALYQPYSKSRELLFYINLVN